MAIIPRAANADGKRTSHWSRQPERVIKVAVVQRGKGGFSSRGRPWISATSQWCRSTVSIDSATARCSRLPQRSIEPRPPRNTTPAMTARAASGAHFRAVSPTLPAMGIASSLTRMPDPARPAPRVCAAAPAGRIGRHGGCGTIPQTTGDGKANVLVRIADWGLRIAESLRGPVGLVVWWGASRLRGRTRTDSSAKRGARRVRPRRRDAPDNGWVEFVLRDRVEFVLWDRVEFVLRDGVEFVLWRLCDGLRGRWRLVEGVGADRVDPGGRVVVNGRVGAGAFATAALQIGEGLAKLGPGGGLVAMASGRLDGTVEPGRRGASSRSGPSIVSRRVSRRSVRRASSEAMRAERVVRVRSASGRRGRINGHRETAPIRAKQPPKKAANGSGPASRMSRSSCQMSWEASPSFSDQRARAARTREATGSGERAVGRPGTPSRRTARRVAARSQLPCRRSWSSSWCHWPISQSQPSAVASRRSFARAGSASIRAASRATSSARLCSQSRRADRTRAATSAASASRQRCSRTSANAARSMSCRSMSSVGRRVSARDSACWR